MGIVVAGIAIGWQAKSIAQIWNWIMMALGAGVMDFPALIKAARYLEVPIVEFDSCAGDILADLKQSVDFLKNL